MGYLDVYIHQHLYNDSLLSDKSKSSSYDYQSTSSSAIILGGSTKEFSLSSFSPSSTGTYYYYTVAYAYIDGAYRITDQLVWTKFTDVVQQQETINYRVYNVQTVPTLPEAGGSITVKVFDGNSFIDQSTKNFNGGESF